MLKKISAEPPAEQTAEQPRNRRVGDKRAKKRPAKLRQFAIRWHSRLGLASALLVFILSLSGLILNRTVDWQLDEQFVKAPWLANWYGLGAKSEPIGFKAGPNWITLLDEQLYMNKQNIGLSESKVLGTVTWDGGVVIAAQTGLTAYSSEGQIFEQINNDELPGNIKRIGRLGGAVIISTHKGAFTSTDRDLRQWYQLNPVPEITRWSAKSVLPTEIREGVIELYDGRGLPMSRILLDIHSGRFFGQSGVYIMDAAAIFLMLLTLSGIYNWWIRR